MVFTAIMVSCLLPRFSAGNYLVMTVTLCWFWFLKLVLVVVFVCCPQAAVTSESYLPGFSCVVWSSVLSLQWYCLFLFVVLLCAAHPSLSLAELKVGARWTCVWSRSGKK
eukprot:scpid88636/ scgid23155/ 